MWEDVLSCVYFQNKNRFQAMSASGNLGLNDTLVRCIQGHSGRIADQIVSEMAHMRIRRAEQCLSLRHI